MVVQDGHIIGANALTSIPALQLATWLLQVMPLFFVAGGFSNITVAQVAIMMLIRGTVSGWIGRPAPWTAVVRFASMAMTVYLWHLSILVIAFLALFGLGIDPSRRIRAGG